jgi:AcrR family transcriptional regulator
MKLHPGNKNRENHTDRKRDRRPEIVAALYRAMLRKGFSGTSLTDLAKGAGMSVSHLLYYFSSKEEVLQALAVAVIRGTWETIEASRNRPPEEQCRALADYNFTGPGASPIYRAIVLELMAVSVHDKRLWQISRANARIFRRHLTDIFRNSPRMPGLDADDAGLIAGALWMGLFVNTRFEPDLNRSRAHRLFLQMMLQLAGLGGSKQSSIGSNGRPLKLGRNDPALRARSRFKAGRTQEVRKSGSSGGVLLR